VAIARVVELAPRRPTAIRELGAGTTRAEMVERQRANGVLSMGLFCENAPEPCCDGSSDLASASSVSLPTIKRLESRPGILAAHGSTLAALRKAIESTGAEFIDENGGGHRARDKAKRTEHERDDDARRPRHCAGEPRLQRF
jgi:hypothetical protein